TQALLADAGMRNLLLRVLPIYEEFAKEQSDDPLGRYQTGRAYHRLGVIHQHLGQLPQADAAYCQAIALLEPLAADFPKVSYYRFDLASRLLNRSDLLRRAGRSREAEQSAEKAKEILDKLVREFPEVRDYRLYLGFRPTSMAEKNRPLSPGQPAPAAATT